MDSKPKYRPATPATADLLYDRTVATRIHLPEPDRLVAEASLVDDTHGPGGFQTFHDMRLRVEVTLPEARITAATAEMAAHPHGGCPGTLSHVQQLVGMRIASGYFHELNQRLGGNRSCNHLLAMAQSIGTVVALSYAARMTILEPEAAELPYEGYFRRVVEEHEDIIGSCSIWRDGGPLVTRLAGPRRSAGR